MSQTSVWFLSLRFSLDYTCGYESVESNKILTYVCTLRFPPCVATNGPLLCKILPTSAVNRNSSNHAGDMTSLMQEAL